MHFSFPDMALIDALIAEQDECADLLKADLANQVLRRVYCRTNYSMVEGCVAYACSYAFAFNERLLRPVAAILQISGLDLDVPILCDVVPEYESILLIEKRPRLEPNGKVKLQNDYGSFVARLNLCMRMIDRVFKTSIYEQYSNAPARSKLIAGHHVRNRITHPKSLAALEIQETELKQITEGCQWFLNFMGHCFQEIRKNMEENNQAVDELLKGIPQNLMISIQANMDRITEQFSRDDFKDEEDEDQGNQGQA